ncbi:MAG: T9SS type A sorting domain-containing protein [Bacteroidia bacterium]|nr:T9SS type A sorting domain-containing protein [Bacteroidia bacterium]
MNLFKKYLSCVVIFILSFYSLNLKAQVVLMHDTSVSLCSGTFYDSGGAGGTYQISEYDTITICSAWPGSQVSLSFTQFAIESGFEHLAIHEGNSAAGLLIVNATGTNLLGQTIFSQGSGCLTLVFTSDGSVNQAGWEATIACTHPCQPFNIDIIGASIPYFNGDTIRACQGQSITFNAAGTYPDNNLNYFQSDTTTVFTWDFGDGSPVQSDTGLSSVTHVFQNGGGYYTTVTGEDINDCNNSNYARNMIMISNSPLYVGTNITQDTICLGESVNLSGLASANAWVQPIPTVVSGLVLIPDGSGVTYTTTLTQTLFASGQVITNVSDLQSLTMNIEHSYLGDLEVWLTCPNGQAVNLIGYYNYACTTCSLPYPGYPQYPGATHLGEPCDITPATSPGLGYTYNWTSIDTLTLPGKSNDTLHNFIDQEGNSILNQPFIPAGNYAPETPFSNLLGCPLNGSWTIHITDHLGADDGYLFYWMLNFNPSIIPPTWTYGNTYNPSNYLWTGSGITTQVNGIGTATPIDTGNVAYIFSVLDDFGCINDTIVTVYVDTSCVTKINTEKLGNFKIEINPNPTTDILNLNINSANSTGLTILIYNMHGVLVRKIMTNLNESVINVSDLEKGVYSIIVVGNNINFSERFVKL